MKSCIGVKMTGNTGTSDQMKTLRENRRLLAKMPKQSLEGKLPSGSHVWR